MFSRRLFRLGLPQGKGFWLGLFMSAMQGVAAVALLATSAWLISRAAEMPPVLYLQLAVVGVRGFALGRAFFRYVERLLLHDAAFRQLEKLRPEVFKALIPFAPAGFGSLRSGQLLSQITSDVDELQYLPLRVVSPLVQSALVTLLSVVGLAMLVPSAAVVLAVACLLAFLLAVPIVAWSGRSADKQNASQRAALSSQVVKLFESLDELRAFEWAEEQLAEIASAESALARSARRSAWSQGIGQAMFAVLSVLATVGSAFFAAQAFDTGQITGVWVALVTLLPHAVFDVLQGVQPVASAWQRYKVSATRVAEVLDARLPEFLRADADTSGAAHVTPAVADATPALEPFENLELRDLSITYAAEKTPVQGFNLKLQAGEVVALTGVSGAGKSSIGLVIAGFIAPSAGSYLFNSKDMAAAQPAEIRKRVAYLQQHSTIFAGDAAANLKVAKPTATDSEMVEVLSRVGLWPMLSARAGLTTNLGELGRAISGGEAARFAVARALLVDFDVLIFDEPTANLDFETAKALIADLVSLAKVRPNRAVLIISHDAEVVSAADRQVVI